MKIGKSYFEDVFFWEDDLFKNARGFPPGVVTPEMRAKFDLAMGLVTEEYTELKEAFEAKDWLKIADGAGDLIWVVCGMMAKMGIDLDAAWAEIRRSNWAKKGGPRREDGKLLKPPDWTPPDFKEALSGRDLMQLVGETQPLECDVCGQKATGVCASPMGAISHALCSECLHHDRQPWYTLVGGLYGVRKDTVADWAKPFIEATCKFYHKTEDELWAEVAKLEVEYDNLRRQMSSEDKA